MAAPRGRGLRPGGVVRAVFRLVLLVSLGFGAGVFIGVVSEEPELLAGHLRGESETVTLTESEGADADGVIADAKVDADASDSSLGSDRSDGETAIAETRRQVLRELAKEQRAEDVALPRVAARASATGAGTGKGRPSDIPVSRRPIQDPPKVKQTSSGSSAAAPDWAIQVGAFSDEGAAKGLVKALKRKGYPVELMPSRGSAKRWRVRVQPISGEPKARKTADRLKREERLPTWVIPMEGRSGS